MRGYRRLETRIGVAIVLAIGAIVALALVHLMILRHGRFTVYQHAWLTKAVQEVFAKVAAAPAEMRPQVIEGLPEARWLSITLLRREPRYEDRPRPPPLHLDDRLAKELESAVHGASAVRVSLYRPSRRPSAFAPPPPPDGGGAGPEPREPRPPGLRPPGPPGKGWWFMGYEPSLTVIPPLASGAEHPPHEDVVPAIFDIRLQLAEGSWLRVTPRQGGDSAWLLDLLLPLIGGAAVIVMLSIYTARRILAPLNALTAATHKLGMARPHTPIPTRGLAEFTAIAEALNDMHGRLSGFVEERTQMLAAISHDLRTALTRLNLSAEDVTDPGLKASLNAQIAEMESMIAATLAFARNDAHNEPLGDVDIAALLISLVDDETDKGHAVAYEGPDHLALRCQRLSIKRAVSNVIDNAVKYGEQVSVRLIERPEQADILVEDHGPGIPEELREKAFAPFQRLEGSRNRDTGGVGLGLTIARDAVRAHMGQITLETAEGGGLAVRIRLQR